MVAAEGACIRVPTLTHSESAEALVVRSMQSLEK